MKEILSDIIYGSKEIYQKTSRFYVYIFAYINLKDIRLGTNVYIRDLLFFFFFISFLTTGKNIRNKKNTFIYIQENEISYVQKYAKRIEKKEKLYA